MNRGEGLRYAAQAKSGKLHLFQEEPKKKAKKFGYKSKNQSFAIRKTDNENQVPQLSKTTGSKPQGKQVNAKVANKLSAAPPQRQATNQRTSSKPVDQREKARTNFINKNKQVQNKSEKTVKRADTITLTQDQLNAILQTIGSTGEAANAPTFAIADGKLQVNQNRDKDESRTDNDNRESEPIAQTDTNAKPEGKSEETISSLVQKGHNTDSNNNDAHSAKHRGPETRIDLNPEPARAGPEVAVASPRGTSDVNSSIGTSGPNDRSLVERKRQQWKQELDAQIAEKKALQEREKASRRRQIPDSAGGWNPWGQPGGGAPPRDHTGGEITSPRENQLNASQPSPGRSRGQGSSDDALRHSVSGPGYAARQQNVPAAMRSSFAIGGIGGETSSDIKRKEQQEWLQQLEKQKREAKEKKDREKASQRDQDSAVMKHWAEPVERPPSQRASRMDTRVGQVRDDFSIMSRTIQEKPEQTEQPKSAPYLSPREPVTDGDPANRMHIRPANMLIDPAELERREMQRKKQLEHIAAVKAQVEEKQRKKREAEEQRRQEEAEQEQRLREDRDRLNQDFELEREKVRRKEEAAAAKHRAMEESMQNAYKDARMAKHQERVRKLQRQGHDVTNLRKSWDANEPSGPYISPRLPAQSTTSNQPPQPSTSQQPPQPSTSLNFSPRGVQGGPPAGTVPHAATRSAAPAIQDAATSPINEVSTQTDMDVLDPSYISPRLIEAIRLASAGAEYKPKDGSKKKDSDRKRQPQEDGRKKEKTTKITSIKEERPDSGRDGGPGRRGSKGEKPKWGQQGAGKKKVKNSDKDMSLSKKKREERLRKRQEELLAMQEKNAPRRTTQRHSRMDDIPVGGESKGRKSRAGTNLANHAEDESRGPASHPDRTRSRKDGPTSRHDGVASQQRGKERRPPSSDDSYKTSSETPPVDFVPFLRTEDEALRVDSFSSSPSSVLIQHPAENEPTRGEAGGKSRQSRQSHREMDPLLNPDRLKDKEHRQEQILLQLSNLRQGLLMKQRELEIGLSSSSSPVIM